jgi:hypothetical protein
MNGQLPPIDRDLRAHLARRSAGRLPEGLASQVLQAVDHAPVAPRRSWLAFSPRPTAAPRTLLAGGSLAAVLLLVAAFVVVPRFQVTPAASGPAGYPADRALTTAELASVMAGPALPANTALVASVTIDAKTDVCPMNRYPTIGVVEGMGSQVCVMGSQVSAYLTTASVTGTFAFRYFGPGYLGLLGEITPASPSKVAFKVADDWPVAGKTFLVDGWLGADETVVPCASLQTSGDVLSPDGNDCPYDNWLSDEQTASPADFPGPQPKRLVEAGGMRQIDLIDHGAPANGVYVVRSVTGPCPGAPPESSIGCPAWRVLAKVADISLPRATAPATATPTTAPPASPVVEPSGPLAWAPAGLLGSGNRPLTQAEFATLWAADPAHLAGRIAIVKGPVPAGFECSGAAATDAQTTSPACVANIVDGQGAPDGYYWAVRVGADGMLSVVGQLDVPPSGYVFPLSQAVAASHSSGNRLWIIDAWLDWEPSFACDTPPYLPDTLCGARAVWSVLTSEPVVLQPMGYPFMAPLPSGIFALDLGLGAYQIFGSQDLNARTIHGIHLMYGTTILARLEPMASP